MAMYSAVVNLFISNGPAVPRRSILLLYNSVRTDLKWNTSRMHGSSFKKYPDRPRIYIVGTESPRPLNLLLTVHMYIEYMRHTAVGI